jgi:hypothetical protein
MSRLFDDRPWTDRSVARRAEPTFAFLDRAPGAYWQRVRDELERWIEAYPGEHRAALIRRIKSSRPKEHRGAWWELYVHALFQALGASVAVIVDPTKRRPDFLVTMAEQQFYVEATTTTGGFGESPAEDRLIDIVDAIPPPPKLGVWVTVVRDGSHGDEPRKTEIHEPIRAWLADLGDPTAWPAQRSAPFYLRAREWMIELTALHMPNRIALSPDTRLIVAGPAKVGYVSDSRALKTALSQKARRYGRLDVPLVVAISISSTAADPESVGEALYGSEVVRVPLEPVDVVQTHRARDGLYMHTSGEQNTRLAGVLVAGDLRPWYLGSRLPDWWPHPWGQNVPLLDDRFPVWKGTERGEVLVSDLTTVPDPRTVFGLRSDWPGPDRPFDC